MNKITKFYGIVEGFFSRPLPIWTTQERLNTLKFISKYAPRVNTYLYCPKNDPYVVKKWDKLYPSKNIADLKQAINYCRQYNITFVFGLNPPLVLFKSEAEKKIWVQKIIQKFEQLKNTGCYNFCLLFDDIPFAYDVLDDPFNTEGKSIGEQVTSLSNEVYDQIKNQIGNLWLCPPDYCFKKKTGFTKQLTPLNPKISIFWTGDEIFVKSINEYQVRRVRNILGEDKKIIWWSNYPVNDCEQNIGEYNLGAFNGPSNKTTKFLKGILVNPMRECFSNLPFYLTFNNYLSNSKKYKRESAWNKSLKKILGSKNSSYFKIFETFSAANKLDTNKYFLTQKTTKIKKDLQEIEKFQNSKSGKVKQMNPYADLFLSSIKTIFQDMKLFLAFYKKISINQEITLKDFLKWDRFSTFTNNPKFFSEVCKIIDYRINLFNFEIKGQEYKTIKKQCQKFINKYPGSLKLNITNQDQNEIKQLTKDYLDYERKLFLVLLNNTPSISDKLNLLALRKNINRFTVIY